MEKIVEAPKYTENFTGSVVWYLIPYVTEIVLALVAYKTSWIPKVWIKAYYEGNMLLYVPFIKLHKTLQDKIQAHTFFLYLFVIKPQPNKKTTKEKQLTKKQSREAIKY